MTITPTLEIEAAITEQAHQRETPPERLALDGLRSRFATSNPTPEEILGLAVQDVLDVEKMALDRSRFAGERSFLGERQAR